MSYDREFTHTGLLVVARKCLVFWENDNIMFQLALAMVFFSSRWVAGFPRNIIASAFV